MVAVFAIVLAVSSVRQGDELHSRLQRRHRPVSTVVQSPLLLMICVQDAASMRSFTGKVKETLELGPSV